MVDNQYANDHVDVFHSIEYLSSLRCLFRSIIVSIEENIPNQFHLGFILFDLFNFHIDETIRLSSTNALILFHTSITR